MRVEKIGVAVNQHVARVGSFADRAQSQAGRQVGRQIFLAVDGEVGTVFEQRDFEFLGEKSAGDIGIDARQGSILQFVAGGFDDFEFKFQFWKRGAALGEYEIRLGKRKGAAASGDEKRVACCVLHVACHQSRHRNVIQQFCGTNVVFDCVIAEFIASFGGDDGQKQANDLCQQFDSMVGYFFRKNMSGEMVPISCFAGRAKRVFIKTRLVFA